MEQRGREGRGEGQAGEGDKGERGHRGAGTEGGEWAPTGEGCGVSPGWRQSPGVPGDRSDPGPALWQGLRPIEWGGRGPALGGPMTPLGNASPHSVSHEDVGTALPQLLPLWFMSPKATVPGGGRQPGPRGAVPTRGHTWNVSAGEGQEMPPCPC